MIPRLAIAIGALTLTLPATAQRAPTNQYANLTCEAPYRRPILVHNTGPITLPANAMYRVTIARNGGPGAPFAIAGRENLPGGQELPPGGTLTLAPGGYGTSGSMCIAIAYYTPTGPEPDLPPSRHVWHPH